ncbi:UDP-4-amino-4,6-dideoxy-N-acetyl-beta-L-altrosamine transaminase [Candidatus Gottesmanbacteria bacterium RBG_13_45_10]|uniref:UDP-4-amino-4, 6-dideoxy-N-acetyl-beta-L-altrosamine transaminase n=1 Tax=Candidatus Gottesmanbacteria bacterium RBG_13_45_10 TaxID=1798370 RepID=A0A1F5ZFY8_9BACT|nr:MAG: UDP-4-amino-4,6-dideoxy-N-acetyl-beta-L-altrosamine transaminase [Candidatus Gottesmanbacteria bacterium RBG_13_45_10]
MGQQNDLPAIEGGKPIREKFLIFGRPQITQDDIESVVDTMRSGWIGTGPKTAIFEDKIAKYVNAEYAVALNSCTAGLHLALLACGIKPKDEVITSSMTFAATANVIEHVGAKPIFVDAEKDSMNIDPVAIHKHITKNTKAIIPVHMAGRPCDMDEIHKIASLYKLAVIEDAAHAFGAKYKGRPIGSLSDITVFSFYVTKNLTTGEGGMVTTNNKKLTDFIRINSLHGLNKGAWKRYTSAGFKNYLVEAAGYKYNMTDMQAAIGLTQLERFENNQKRRKQIWDKYTNAFADLPLILPSPILSSITHAFHLYTILVDLDRVRVNKDFIQTALGAENIGVGTHFIALHLHPYYRNKYGFKRGDYPNAEFISDRTISLPLSADMTDFDVESVIKATRKIFLFYTAHDSKHREARGVKLNEILPSRKH